MFNLEDFPSHLRELPCSSSQYLILKSKKKDIIRISFLLPDSIDISTHLGVQSVCNSHRLIEPWTFSTESKRLNYTEEKLWTNSLLMSLMSTTDGETIISTRARYYVSIFYKYDSAHIVSTSGVFNEVRAQHTFLTSHFAGQRSIWTQ